MFEYLNIAGTDSNGMEFSGIYYSKCVFTWPSFKLKLPSKELFNEFSLSGIVMELDDISVNRF